MVVMVVEVSANGVLKFTGAAVDGAAQLFFGEQPEPAFDQVEPRAAGGSEVETEAGMAEQPALDRCGLVRAGASLGVERGEQRGGAVPHVSAVRRLAWPGRIGNNGWLRSSA